MIHTLNLSYDDETNEFTIEENCSPIGKIMILVSLMKKTEQMRKEIKDKDHIIESEIKNGDAIIEILKNGKKGD